VLGAVLAGTTTPGTAHLLYDAVNRLDGVKMLALAGLGLAGAASGMLPRWLRYTGIALAIAIAASSLAYLLLLQGLAVLAVPAGVLLLIFITGAGITLGTSTNQPISDAPAARKADADVGVLS
jgi:CHASE2 domain-containing sensor protein